MCDDIGFARVTLAECHHFHTIVQVCMYIKLYKILYHFVPAYLQDILSFLRMLLDLLEGTVIV